MPIEFTCPSCQKTLRVPDENAGMQARCPECQQVTLVPGAPAADPFPNVDTGNSTNPYTSPQLHKKPESATVGGGAIRNVPVEVGPVLNYAFEVWKANIGLLVGVFVVVFVLTTGINYAIIFGVAALRLDPDFQFVVTQFLSIIPNLISIFLGIGQYQIILKLLRGQRAEFGELFGGGPRFLPVFVVSLLLGLMIGFGTLLCIVPGIILAFLFWPAYFLIVDGKTEIMESFTVARTVSENNYLTIFVLYLACIGIVFLGLLAFCIGIIFAAPLISVIFATAYLMMSGQLDVNR